MHKLLLILAMLEQGYVLSWQHKIYLNDLHLPEEHQRRQPPWLKLLLTMGTPAELLRTPPTLPALRDGHKEYSNQPQVQHLLVSLGEDASFHCSNQTRHTA